MNKLYNHYSIDECSNKEKLFNELNHLKSENKIEWSKEDIDLIKIIDIDLDSDEELDLIETLEKFDLYPFMDYQDGEIYNEEDDYDGYDDYENPKKKKYDDDSFDY